MRLHQIFESGIPNRVAQDGNVYYFDDEGKLHRDGDMPAIEWKDGRKSYYRHGVELSNSDKPVRTQTTTLSNGELIHTIRWPDGTIEEARENQRSGTTTFCDKNGFVHRDYRDLPAIYLRDGSRMWYRHGQLHRDGDRPAVISAHVKEWRRDGDLDRRNGKAAVIHSNGVKEWWIAGIQVHESFSSDDDEIWHPPR